jgi:Tol biopolymer transport system component
LATNGEAANGICLNPSVSEDGRWVVFYSEASNLVGADTNGVADIFLRDRLAGTTRRVSVGPNGVQLSADSAFPAISGDGSTVAFSTDAPELNEPPGYQVYVHDVASGVTELVSRNLAGTAGAGVSRHPAISYDGQFVAFESGAPNLVPNPTHPFGEIFLLDRSTGTIEQVSKRSDGSTVSAPSVQPSISDDGRYVAFSAYGALDPADSNQSIDVYVRDRWTSATQRGSLAHNQAELTGVGVDSVISGDGQWVVFTTSMAGVVPGSSNGVAHVYLRNLRNSSVRRISMSANGTLANDNNIFPFLGHGGSLVGFYSYGNNWTPDWGAPTIQETIYLVSPDIDEIHSDGF